MKPKTLRAIQPNAGVEAAFRRELTALLDRMHAETETLLEFVPLPILAMDAKKPRRQLRILRASIGELYEQMLDIIGDKKKTLSKTDVEDLISLAYFIKHRAQYGHLGQGKTGIYTMPRTKEQFAQAAAVPEPLLALLQRFQTLSNAINDTPDAEELEDLDEDEIEEMRAAAKESLAEAKAAMRSLVHELRPHLDAYAPVAAAPPPPPEPPSPPPREPPPRQPPPPPPRGPASGSVEGPMNELIERWRGIWDRRARPAAAQALRDAYRHSDSALKSALRDQGFSVQFTMTPAMQAILDQMVRENAALITNVPEQYFERVVAAIKASVTAGRDVGSLSAALQSMQLEGMSPQLQKLKSEMVAAHPDKGGTSEAFREAWAKFTAARTQEETNTALGMSKRRAQLIAMNQNNIATARFNQVRQQEIGITRAVWMHSHAGKEPRPSHVKMHNKQYDITIGMWDDTEQKHVLPGQLPNCRCSSKSVIPGIISTETVRSNPSIPTPYSAEWYAQRRAQGLSTPRPRA